MVEDYYFLASRVHNGEDLMWQSLDEQCYQFWLIFSVLSLELHLFLSDLLNNYVNPFMVEELQCFIPVGTLISAIELGALTPSIQKLMYLTEFSEQHKHES